MKNPEGGKKRKVRHNNSTPVQRGGRTEWEGKTTYVTQGSPLGDRFELNPSLSSRWEVSIKLGEKKQAKQIDVLNFTRV